MTRRKRTTNSAARAWARSEDLSLERWCQSHDVKNLFVVDGSVFPSASEKNPTHTMMALAAAPPYIATGC